MTGHINHQSIAARHYLLVLCILLATGCTTSRIVYHHSYSPKDTWYFSVGDKVSVQLKNGQSHEFVVTEISNQWVKGNDIQLDRGDIAVIKRTEVAPVRTAGVLVVLGLYIYTLNNPTGFVGYP